MRSHTRLSFLTGLLLLTFASFSVFAQTIPARANISWQLPVESECLYEVAEGETCARLPLTDSLALTAIEVYVSGSPIADDAVLTPTAILPGNAVSAVYNAVVPAGSTLYIRAKALNAYGASKYSLETTKFVDVPNVKPGVPVNVTIELQIGVVAAPTG